MCAYPVLLAITSMQQAASNAQRIAKNAIISLIVLNAKKDMLLIAFILAANPNVK